MGKSFRCKLGLHSWEVGASGVIILCKFCGIGKHKRKDRGSLPKKWSEESDAGA